jgi:hypothetical protein
VEDILNEDNKCPNDGTVLINCDNGSGHEFKLCPKCGYRKEKAKDF